MKKFPASTTGLLELLLTTILLIPSTIVVLNSDQQKLLRDHHGHPVLGYFALSLKRFIKHPESTKGVIHQKLMRRQRLQYSAGDIKEEDRTEGGRQAGRQEAHFHLY